MFLREKKSGDRVYLQLVENRREEGRTKQQVIATLGRLDQLTSSGELDGLVRSASRYCEALTLVASTGRGNDPTVKTLSIGPALLFERLWERSGCRAVLEYFLSGRRFEFDVERAVFLTVLHRLFASGSDRAAEKWRSEYLIQDTERLQLHQLYRAMAWLGDELPGDQQEGRTPFSPRCVKDLIEEELFLRRRDLLTTLDIMFFDTTSIYFEGEGGDTLGEYGHSKDSRPDLRQMVVGAVLDNDGDPVCSELWPGNTTGVKTLLPVSERLRKRFGITSLCVVADRGMFSKDTIQRLDDGHILYIVGARMRKNLEVRDEVLSRAGRYHEVHGPRSNSKDPSPLQVKEVEVEGRRYIVCVNEEQRRKDAADRQAILVALEENLKQGDKALVGNNGFRKYLKQSGHRFEIDYAAAREEERYDGKWVLRTNTDFDTEEVALKYKQLWTVEEVFRSAKTLLDTRPIFHKCDETIRGHVFCSFLALLLRKRLQDCLDQHGLSFEWYWQDILRDLGSLCQTEVLQDGKRLVLRSEAKGTCGRVFKAVGVALPKTVQALEIPVS